MHAFAQEPKKSSVAGPAPGRARPGQSRDDNSAVRWEFDFSKIPVYPSRSGIQAELTVNTPGDAYEQEADRVADDVMRGLEGAALPGRDVSGGTPDRPVQRMHAELDRTGRDIQRRDAVTEPPTVAPAVAARLDATLGGGEPLPTPVRSLMEPRFGVDFSRVRVHTGSHAARLNRELSSWAFTRQRDIYFGAGAYEPQSAAGQRLLAHELAHVVQQQRGLAPMVQRLEQRLPFVGPLTSYLNPLNQAARLVLPALSATQKSLLDGIFKSALSTSIIRLNPNSILAAGNCFRTTGNIINMPDNTIDDSHLIHEAAHVWQHQNDIPFAYAVSALRAQAYSQILRGDWQRAYDYAQLERLHIPWRYWNAEQQAHWIQDNRRLPDAWWLAAVNLPELMMPGPGGPAGPGVSGPDPGVDLPTG
jgi:Domain of unknown function (DUF4157)